MSTVVVQVGRKSNSRQENLKTYEAKDGQMAKTALGLEENVEGALAYLLGFFTGIALILMEKDNDFVKFHAWQSTITYGVLFVLSIGLVFLGFIPVIGWIVSIVGILLSLIIAPIALILWLVFMLKAYQGQKWKFPVIGNLAEKQAMGGAELPPPPP